MYPLIALTLCFMTLVQLCSVLDFPNRSALLPVHFLSVHVFSVYHSVANLTSVAAPTRRTPKVLDLVKPKLLSQVLRWETTSVSELLTSICPNVPLPYCFSLFIEHSLVCYASFLYTPTHIL